MTMKLGVQEEPAIYKVLTEPSRIASRSLRSLGVWSGGGTPSKSVAAYWTGGTIPWVSPKDMKVARIRDAEDHITADAVAGSATSLVKAGAVVLVVRSGILKHSLPVAVTDVDVALNQDMKALQPFAGVEAAYVAWALRANAQQILQGCTKAGTTVQSIEMPALLDFEIFLPAPNEQRNVVETVEARLSLLDASVAGLHRVQANLKRYRASVLKSACEGRLVPTEAELARQEGRDFEAGAQLLQRILTEQRARCGQRKYKESTSPALADLPELPSGWHWGTMPQLGELNRGKSKHRPRDDEKLYGGPHPFIQTGDVRHADGVLSRHSQTYSDFGLAQSRLWPTGTLCITIAANIAETARLSYPACFPDSIVGFVCDSGEAMTKWVQIFLATAKENLETFAPGTAQKNINLEVLQNVAVPLPPLAEQHRIVAEADRRLSLIRVAQAQVSANLARAQRLRQSILQAAFRTPAQAGQ